MNGQGQPSAGGSTVTFDTSYTRGHTVTEPPVRLRIEEGVAWITLDRPRSLNAFSQSLMDRLNVVLDEIDADGRARVIVVTGAGDAFSAGGDLKEFKARLDTGRHDELLAFIEYTATTLTRLEDSVRPVIAAVNGTAVAGGLELVLCCDMVLAAEHAMIGDGHLRYGVLPGAGGATRLVQKIPHNIASRLLMTGELVSAEFLRDAGLVNEVLPAPDLLIRAAELANQIAALSPTALGHVKRVSREARSQPASIGLKLELSAFQSYVHSRDLHEGMSAFSERRTPEFGSM